MLLVTRVYPVMATISQVFRISDRETGQNCQLICSNGTYGFECGFTCECQNGGTCHHVTGACTCLNGFKGQFCETPCPVGFFGTKCKLSCHGQCQNEGICNNVTAECTCQPGFTGQHCESVCPLGTYGQGCESLCECHNFDICHLVTGKCLCLPGYMGDKCELQCPEGFYGNNCSSNCDCKNATGPCNSETGACNCTSGFKGRDCSEECAVGEYGPHCVKSCTCGFECDAVTGKCGELCPYGFQYEPTCETQCSHVYLQSYGLSNFASLVYVPMGKKFGYSPDIVGNYGQNCENTCDSCDEFGDTTCDKELGNCLCVTSQIDNSCPQSTTRTTI